MEEIKIVLIISSLRMGGKERVMSELANYFIIKGIKVELILLTKYNIEYTLHPDITVVKPSFTINQKFRPFYIFRLFFYLRSKLNKSKAKTGLTFGGKYNAFVLLASFFTGMKIFISERSKPSISYGKFLDFVNPYIYKLASGIIAQTNEAKEVLFKKTNHSNIKVIPNPIREIKTNLLKDRAQIILNVGRFIKSKNQDLLVKYFSEIDPQGWELKFIGNGKELIKVKNLVSGKKLSNKVSFIVRTTDVDTYYLESSIFAFTSDSEGFPNALAEAMASGCACISFDCKAGPSDLIDDGINGFLIPEGDHEQYIKKLKILINDLPLRKEFGKKSIEKLQNYQSKVIGEEFLKFIQ